MKITWMVNSAAFNLVLPSIQLFAAMKASLMGRKSMCIIGILGNHRWVCFWKEETGHRYVWQIVPASVLFEVECVFEVIVIEIRFYFLFRHLSILIKLKDAFNFESRKLSRLRHGSRRSKWWPVVHRINDLSPNPRVLIKVWPFVWLLWPDFSRLISGFGGLILITFDDLSNEKSPFIQWFIIASDDSPHVVCRTSSQT